MKISIYGTSMTVRQSCLLVVVFAQFDRATIYNSDDLQ